MFVDCHTHLDEFDSIDISSILNRAHNAGIRLIITSGTTLDSSRNVVSLVNSHTMLYGGVGLHPMNLRDYPTEEDYASLKMLITTNNKIITMSEIGLDFTETSPPKKLQEQVFRDQIRIARDLQLPIIFHCRNAFKETINILTEECADKCGGIFHYFQGDLPTAKAAIELGFYISMAKPLLRLPELQKTVSNIPLSKIVLETDCAPQPWKKYRKNWTEPYNIVDIGQKLAEIKNTSLGDVEQMTTKNILAIFNANLKHTSVKTSLNTPFGKHFSDCC